MNNRLKEIIRKQLEEESATGTGASFTAGTGENYATPAAFNPNTNAKGAKNIYYYKLGFKPEFNFAMGLKKFTDWVLTQEVKESKYEESIKEMIQKGLFK